jgi:hypothetical protein
MTAFFLGLAVGFLGWIAISASDASDELKRIADELEKRK